MSKEQINMKIQNEENNNNFICINCDNNVKELFKKYSPSVLKIIKCEKCQNIADKYIEFETIIILIDLVLLSIPAYKHVLYNTDFKNHWKLAVVLLLVESYLLWCNKTNLLEDQPQNKDLFFEEKGFYLCSLQILIGYILQFLLILLFTKWTKSKTEENISTLLVRKGIVLANSGKFFLLTIMIWKNNSTEFGIKIHQYLVTGYVLLSFLYIYTILYKRTKKMSVVIIISAFIIHYLISQFIESCFNYYFY